MISDKTKNLFKFIEFLYSNIDNFKQYDEVIKRRYDLEKQLNNLSADKSFEDKLKYDEVSNEIKNKLHLINDKIIIPITNKGIQLNICEIKQLSTVLLFNNSDIEDLKKNVNKNDIPEILNSKNKYFEFRTKTIYKNYTLDFLFSDLDKRLNKLFIFFLDTKENEFGDFKKQPIQANNFSEAYELSKKGHNKIVLPNDFLSPSSLQQKKNEIEVWYSEYELRQFIDMAIRWSIKGVYADKTEHKPFSIFDIYIKNSRYNFELFSTQLKNKLTENSNWKAFEIDLKDRFLGMLNQYIKWYALNKKETEKFIPYNPYELMFGIIESTKKEILKYFPDLEKPKQTETKKPDAVNENLHPEIFNGNAFEVWQSMFDSFEITQSNYSTDIDFMFEVMKYNNLIHDYIGLTVIKKWINKVHEISFEKIRYTNPKSTANTKRLIIYNEITSK